MPDIGEIKPFSGNSKINKPNQSTITQKTMKKLNPSLLLAFLIMASANLIQAQEKEYSFEKDTVKFTRQMLPDKYVPDTRIDNMGYWQKMAEAGLVPVAPNVPAAPAIQRSSKIMAPGLPPGNSIDVNVSNTNSTQSENSIFVSPETGDLLLNSNNSTPQPSTGSIYGADYLFSADSGQVWGGSFQGAGGGNSGDPAAVINNNGRWFVGFINNASGQSVAFSDNEGTSWTVKVAGTAPSGIGNMNDKNHLWIDNSTTSPYNGYLYDAWTPFGGSNDGQIVVARSIDNGVTWQSPIKVSAAVNAGSHNQGVHIKTGPDGEVYVIWAIYDSWPSDEKAIGLAKSMDGGMTWLPSYRIIDNLKGIRNHAVTQNMRVNSFPSMAVDVSNGPDRGTIYVSWTNVNTPGVNTGQGVEVYMIKSADQGVTWSTPLKVNTDPLGTGKQHYLPWITCDPDNGNVSIVFYDNRNVAADYAEAWVAVSLDGGETFEDFRVSDVSFKPQPIPNMATGYFGDYLAITSKGGMVYPCWTDNRSGWAQTYVSPFMLTPAMNMAFIAYQSHQVDDFTLGNANGLLDNGENLNLTVAMKNIGDMPGSNVDVILSSDSPMITATDSIENYGDFTIGQIKSINDGFAIHVSDSMPDGTEVVFNLKAVDANDSIMFSNFTIIAHAPALKILGMTVNDPLGNNNHILEPGETAELIVTYLSTGDYTATNAVSHLVSQQSFVSITNPSVNLGNIDPGQTATATFIVQVSDVPLGSAAIFDNVVNYSSHVANRSFVKSIGLIVEDWETGNFNKFPWSFTGTGNWSMDNTVKYEGQYSAQTAAISHGQSVGVQVDYSILYPDSISFFCKVSSELFHDVLGFFIDGAKVGQWSGNVNWKRVAFPVTAGAHTFKWEYLKDASNSSGLDKAWVDFIVFPPEQKTMAWAGSDLAICEDATAQLNASAAFYQTLQWSTSGSGTFDNATILNPVYTPSAADISAGSVVITLTVYGISVGETSIDNLTLTLTPKPTAFAGNDSQICFGDSYNIGAASATNFSSLAWTSSGDGVFSDPSVIIPVYTPGGNDKANGSVLLFLKANSIGNCGPVTDTILLTINALPTVSLAISNAVCSGDSTQLTYTLAGEPPFQVAIGGGEIVNIPASPYSVWVKPANNTSFSVSSITDANGCVANVNESVSVEVLPTPTVKMAADTALCANLVLNLASNASGAASYLWMPGGQNTTTLSVDTTGIGMGEHIYTLKATGSNGCITNASTTVFFRDCTGIDEMAGNVGFKVYPNPGNGLFNIEFVSRQKENVAVRIYSTNGILVKEETGIIIQDKLLKSCNLKNMAAGTYLLTIENNNIKVSRELIIVK